MRYRADLQQCWPEAQVTVCDETPKCSSYQLCHGQRQLWLSFQVSAEDQHLPVALASMTAKYTRELLMERLNGYFGQHLPDLRPTAGYVQDARRYLQDIDPIIQECHIDRSQLVRSC
jgi:ribonuclease HII